MTGTPPECSRSLLLQSNMEDRPLQQNDPNIRATFSGSKLMESNVDLIVFGHEQDGSGHLTGGGKNFELTNKEWVGHKKRVGHADANNSEIDMVVFNHDTVRPCNTSPATTHSPQPMDPPTPKLTFTAGHQLLPPSYSQTLTCSLPG